MVLSVVETSKEGRQMGSGCEGKDPNILPLNGVAREGLPRKRTF